MTTNRDKLQALVGLSTRMVVAAERQAWDELSEIGAEYFSLFEQLPANLSAAPLRPLLQTLADNEQNIREHIDPWLAATRTLLDAWETSARAHSTPPPAG